jgi:hypothetical protein
MLLVESSSVISVLSHEIFIRLVQLFDLQFIFLVLFLILLYLLSKSPNLLRHLLVVCLGLIVSPH